MYFSLTFPCHFSKFTISTDKCQNPWKFPDLKKLVFPEFFLMCGNSALPPHSLRSSQLLSRTTFWRGDSVAQNAQSHAAPRYLALRMANFVVRSYHGQNQQTSPYWHARQPPFSAQTVSRNSVCLFVVFNVWPTPQSSFQTFLKFMLFTLVFSVINSMRWGAYL